MSHLTKAAIPVVAFFVMYMIYIFTPSDAIGNFEQIRSNGEINQNVNVLVEHSRGFKKDGLNRIVTFYARDKKGALAVVNPKQPVSPEIENAQVVELFGHMHGSNFVALSVDVVKYLD